MDVLYTMHDDLSSRNREGTSRHRGQTSRRIGIAGLLLAAVIGPVAAVSAQPATPPPAVPATPASGLERIADTVWIVAASSDVAVGTRYAFLSPNVLVIASEGSRPSLGTWATRAGHLEITEEGVAYEVDVLELTSDRFRIRIHNPGAPTEITFAPPGRSPAAAAPADAPTSVARTAYRCGSETYRVAFEGGRAHVALPDGAVVALEEATVPDAPASRRTFTNGTLTFVEDTSEAHTRVLFARGRLRPRPCTSLP